MKIRAWMPGPTRPLFEIEHVLRQRVGPLAGRPHREETPTRCSTCSRAGRARRRRRSARAARRGSRSSSRGARRGLPTATRAASRCSSTTRSRRAGMPCVDLNAVERGTATAGRQFLLGATPGGRLRVGDAVHRARPARPRARPLPHLRRGDLRARGRGRPRDRRRAGAASGRLVRPPAGAARALPREHRRHGAAAARRLPAGGLAGRGLLPRRHPPPSRPEE